MKLSLSALKIVKKNHPEVDPCLFHHIITQTRPSQQQLADFNASYHDFEMLKAEVEAECEKEYKHRQVGWKIVHVDEGFTLARFLTDEELNYHDVVFLCSVRNLLNFRDSTEPLSCDDVVSCMESADWYCYNYSGIEDIEPLLADDPEECMGDTYDNKSPGYAELMAIKKGLQVKTCIGTIIYDSSRNCPIVAIEGNYQLDIEDAVNIAANGVDDSQLDDTFYYFFEGYGYVDSDYVTTKPWYKDENNMIPVIRQDDPKYLLYMFM